MKTKDKIVEKLLENKHITAEEAIVLLKEKPNDFKQFPISMPPINGKVPYHTICGCNICYCVIGNKMVDPESSGNFQKLNTYTTSTTDNFQKTGCQKGDVQHDCDGSCKK